VLANVLRTLDLKTQIGSLRGELRKLGRFGPLIGASAAMQRVYDLVAKVGPTEAGVLITGESGTGKELVAQTIHELSPRKDQPFVAINCGAVSATLIESELFGHEKGSFTGATKQHQGHFERASGGTLFLDEITEMPTELQAPTTAFAVKPTSTRCSLTGQLACGQSATTRSYRRHSTKRRPMACLVPLTRFTLQPPRNSGARNS
jgi:DNA-binding NtrC family response regulator